MCDLGPNVHELLPTVNVCLTGSQASESVRNVEKVRAICGAVRMIVRSRGGPVCVNRYQSAPASAGRLTGSNARAGFVNSRVGKAANGGGAFRLITLGAMSFGSKRSRSLTLVVSPWK